MDDWKEAAAELLSDMVRLRRAIHAEPELGLQNPLTARKAREALKDLPLEFIEGGATSGFVATLRGPASGRTVLLRADMDALPMQEDTGLPFASSRFGVMHACGHDAHVAMLVAAARLLCARRERLSGTVQFMFQPGEEGFHGARHMLDDGLISPIPDAAFALHVSPNVPFGIVAGRAGPLLAAADRFEISLKGKGGHASQPHEAIDPIPVACELVLAIQSMATRRLAAFDPAVITVGRIEAGTANNVIPETATIEGTIRSFSESARSIAHEGLRRLATHLASAHLCSAAIVIEEGFPVTVCDTGAARLAKRAVSALFGDGAWMEMPTPAMGAEDFAYILQKVPGAMVFLGASPEGGDWRTCCSLHSNRMVLDERAMADGAALHCAIAEAFLAGGFEHD